MNWKLIDEACIRPGMSLKHNKNIDWDPNYGNVLILAGGAGSGKGFAYDSAIEFNGKKFDVDELKKSMRKFKPGSGFDKKFFDQYGKHLKDTDFQNEEDVFNLHQFCKDIGIDDKLKRQFFNDIRTSSKTKPNITFDVTLKDSSALGEIVGLCKQAGYDSRCIHIIWILNDYDKAKEQNAARARRVPGKILDKTHEGVSKHFKEILDRADDISDGIDGTGINGDIWIFFNQSGVDNFVRKSDAGGMEMSTINAVKVKAAGRPIADFDTIMNMKVKEFDDKGNIVSNNKVTVRDKIENYVPNTTKDVWKKDNMNESNVVRESSITRIMRHNEEHDCICMTAFRSDREKDDDGIHKRKAKMSNRTANNALGTVLRKMGYGITKVIGQYPEMIEDENGEMSVTGSTVKESSWFVVNNNDDADFLEVCADLAERDNQDSILFIPRGTLTNGKGCFLYGTNPKEGAWPAYKEKIMTDGIKVNGDSEYSTKIDGKEFAFNLVDESSESFLKSSSMFSAQAKYSYIKNHYGIDLLKR